jgi:hypothetical protein
MVRIEAVLHSAEAALVMKAIEAARAVARREAPAHEEQADVSAETPERPGLSPTRWL